MARVMKTLAMAIAIAFVALLPAWGQTGSVATTTLSNLKFGQDSTDSTMTWSTTLRLVNRTSNAMHNEISAVNPLCAKLSSVYGGTVSVACGDMSYVSPLGEDREVLAGLTPTTAAQNSQVTVQSLQNADGLPNIVASATVQQVDASSNIVQSYEVVDPTTVAKNPGILFGFGADIGVAGVDTDIILSVPTEAGCRQSGSRAGAGATLTLLKPKGGCASRGNSENVNVTVAIYDGYNTATGARSPIASVTFGLPAGRPASSTLSQLFAENADLIKAFANPPLMGNGQPDPMVQQFVTITSDVPVSLNVTRLNTNSDGSIVTTGAYAFPLASQ